MQLTTTTQALFGVENKKDITNYRYNGLNQLYTQFGLSGAKEEIANHTSDQFNYEYDKRGNMIGISSDDHYILQQHYDSNNKLAYSSDKQNNLTKYTYDGLGRRIKKMTESSETLSTLSPICAGNRGQMILGQIVSSQAEAEPFNPKRTQNFVYHPLSQYDDVLITYGKGMHTQKFLYGAKDKDKGLIKVESYTATGDRWQAGSSDIYRGECDLINDHNALDTLKDAKMPTTQYVISDIRGSIEQLTGINGKKTRTFTYSAFGEELSDMLLDDIHGFTGYVRDTETGQNYANSYRKISEANIVSLIREANLVS